MIKLRNRPADPLKCFVLTARLTFTTTPLSNPNPLYLRQYLHRTRFRHAETNHDVLVGAMEPKVVYTSYSREQKKNHVES